MILSFMIPIIANAEPDDLILSSGKALEALGVLVGNNDGDLMLSNNLYRQDMVVLVSRLYKEENKAKAFLVKPQFTDVTDSYEFYKPYIGWSVDKGLIKGMGNNEFGIDKKVTAHQYMTVLLRVLGYEEESRLWNTVPDIAIKLGIMNGLQIKPQTEITRGQMAVMTFNTLKLTIKGSTLTLADKLNLKF
jgi:hypothetical protein